jgi:hypothetical protein
MERVFIYRFTYRNMLCNRGCCGIEAIKLKDGRVVVIATELEDNPGMSITNAAEYVATQICRSLDIDPHKLVWIEHYGYVSPMRALRPRTYDRVTFTRITPGHELYFHEPTWSVMKETNWCELGLEPRPDGP